MPSVTARQTNSKWGVSPLITHPRAIKASGLFLPASSQYFFIAKGISTAPGTWQSRHSILPSSRIFLHPANNSSTMSAFHSVLITTTEAFFSFAAAVFDFPDEDMLDYLTTPSRAR